MITLEFSPVDAVGIARVVSLQVEAVEVRTMATRIPPCSTRHSRTVLTVAIFIEISSTELGSMMFGQTITYSKDHVIQMTSMRCLLR